jgi:hypothetical protein
MLFATMGPIKVLITFTEKTLELDKPVRQRVAIKEMSLC